MRTWGQCNCCRKHRADQRCNLRENEVLSDDLISLVGRAEPQGFSDLSSWVNNICVCITDFSEVTTGEKNMPVRMSLREELK